MQIDKSTMESREVKSARKNEYRRDVQAGNLHTAVKRLAVREQGVGVDAAKRAIEAYPGQLLAQIDYLIDNIPMQAGIGRARRMGLQSIRTYRKRLKAGVTHMKKLNMRPESIMDITSKQIEKMFEHFFEEEKSASYLGSMNTIFRRFGVWLNKPELVPPLKYMTDDENLIKRTTAATSPKDWMMEDDEIDQVIESVAAICEVTAVQLKMARYFGLRVEEALCARPADMIRHGPLQVFDGTKGGRPRSVPIETEKHRSVLAEALELSQKNAKGILTANPKLTLKAATQRFYRTVRKAGINHKDMEVVAHGLRHGYAREAYIRLTGVEPPVRGGPRIDPALEEKTRKEIVERLGHSRDKITSAYIGSHLGMSRFKSKNIKKLIGLLDGDEVLVEQAREMGAIAVYVCGTAADGARIDKASSVVIGIDLGGALASEQFKAFGSRVKVLLDCEVVGVMANQSIDSAISRLELLGLVDGARTIKHECQTIDSKIKEIQSLNAVRPSK